MANNEDINRNDLITPILPSSSDFVNNLPNNPEGHNLEEGIICIQPSPKLKIIKYKESKNNKILLNKNGYQRTFINYM